MAYNKTEWINNQEPAINAYNLNKMEQGIYDAVTGVDKKNNYIVAYKNNNQTINVAGTSIRYYINAIMSQNGQGLIFHGADGTSKANSIEIGSGIHHVEVNSQVYITAYGTATTKSLYIYKNESQVTRAVSNISSNYETMATSKIIIPVQEGDIITTRFRSNTGTNTVLGGSTNGDNLLCIKVID